MRQREEESSLHGEHCSRGKYLRGTAFKNSGVNINLLIQGPDWSVSATVSAIHRDECHHVCLECYEMTYDLKISIGTIQLLSLAALEWRSMSPQLL